MPAIRGPNFEFVRAGLRLLLAAIYYLVGVWHLTVPGDFVPIVPTWAPAPHALVIFTGWCELLGATGLLIPRLRRFAGVMLAIYAVCVFPANIRQAFDHIPFRGHPVGWDFNGPRFAFEPVLIWWPLFCAGVIDWPFRRRRDPSPAPQAQL
jgi:uncharacterized membrane protein